MSGVNRKRLERVAEAAGRTGNDELDGLTEALLEGRRRGYVPATETKEQIEAKLHKLEAVRRPSEMQRLAIRIQRARLQAGRYIGSRAEEERIAREAEELLGMLELPGERIDLSDITAVTARLAGYIDEQQRKGMVEHGEMPKIVAILEAARARKAAAELLEPPPPDAHDMAEAALEQPAPIKPLERAAAKPEPSAEAPAAQPGPSVMRRVRIGLDDVVAWWRKP